MTASKKAIVIVSVVGSLAVAGLFIAVWLFERSLFNPVYELKRPLEQADLAVVKQAVGLDLPDISAVRHIALVHGKDTSLYALLELPEVDATRLLLTVKNRAKLTDTPFRVPDSTWLDMGLKRAPEAEVNAAFDDPKGFHYGFCAAHEGRVNILVITGHTFPRAFYDLFAD